MHLGQCSELANPLPTPVDEAPPSVKLLSSGSECIATQPPPVILCNFRLPSTAHCQLPRVGLQLSWPQEPFLIHSPEATAQRGQAGRARNTPTWLGPLRLITP